jgi:hypothetical protein
MVANFGRYKRHHVLFRALARIPEANRPKVVLVGQPQDQRTADVLLQEIADYGVGRCITLRTRITDVEVVDILCRSKTSLITSLREGSCVAVVEAMMADTPVGLLQGSQLGSACFLNDRTGRWLQGDRLHCELPHFIAESHHYSPRAWLLENGVDYETSTRRLNQHLRSAALARGEPWTRDLFAHHWRPNPTLADPAAAREAAQAATSLEREFGLVITSCRT